VLSVAVDEGVRVGGEERVGLKELEVVVVEQALPVADRDTARALTLTPELSVEEDVTLQDWVAKELGELVAVGLVVRVGHDPVELTVEEGEEERVKVEVAVEERVKVDVGVEEGVPLLVDTAEKEADEEEVGSEEKEAEEEAEEEEEAEGEA